MSAVSLMSFAAPYCQPWPPDQNWVRELAVSALKSFLGAMTFRILPSWTVTGWACRVWLGEGVHR